MGGQRQIRSFGKEKLHRIPGMEDQAGTSLAKYTAFQRHQQEPEDTSSGFDYLQHEHSRLRPAILLKSQDFLSVYINQKQHFRVSRGALRSFHAASPAQPVPDPMPESSRCSSRDMPPGLISPGGGARTALRRRTESARFSPTPLLQQPRDQPYGTCWAALTPGRPQEVAPGVR